MPHVQVATQVQKQKCVATNLHATENHWSITASYTIRVLQKSAPPDLSSQVAFKIIDYHVNYLRKTPLCQYPSDGSCSSINVIGLLNLFLSLFGFKRICRKLRSFLTFYIKSRERLSRYLLYIQFNMILKRRLKACLMSFWGDCRYFKCISYVKNRQNAKDLLLMFFIFHSK